MAEPEAQHDTVPRADYEDRVQALSAGVFFRRSCRRPFDTLKAPQAQGPSPPSVR